ncbi:MAG: O-antigen ligase family protein [Anaerolineae bacterium]|nr:O-antigen ligase family protein [Anaerolineae bacterium]
MKNPSPSSINVIKITRFLWAATLLSLPVTSFRYFPGLSETTFVRPLAVYPLVILMLLLGFQLLGKKISYPLPNSLIVLGAFLMLLLAATIFGALHAPLDLRGQTYLGRTIRAWVTVIIGVSFFVSAVWMNRNEENLKFSVRWLLAGFVLTIAWSGLQAVTFYTPLIEKVTVTHWQLAFSMRELVKTNRISGLAYEPAWLAGQIATVYLPWLFAAIIMRTHFTRFKWLEAFLFVLSGLLLLMTFSRGGLLTALIAVSLTFLLVGANTMRLGRDWFSSGIKRGKRAAQNWWAAISLRIGIVILVIGVVVGAINFLGQKNYIKRLWNTQAESLVDFIVQNSAGARAAYNWAGMSVYKQHPWLGVGLGASGFYLYDNLPDWSLTTVPEIARQLNPSNRLYPNPKNMYVRVLAESGLVGFAFFLAFQFGLLGDALSFLRKPHYMRLVGIAGVCSWIAISLYNFTQDSFTTPNIWINLGILVGITRFNLNNGLENSA